MAPPPQVHLTRPLQPLMLAAIFVLCAQGATRAEAASAPSSSSSASFALPAACAAAPLSMPRVPSRDQSPTPDALLGLCTERVEAHTRLTSSWCRAPPLREFVPSAPAGANTFTTAADTPPRRPLAAENCAKRGRMSVYRGPVLGYDADNTHVGACNATLVGSATHALVAVSTAHLSSREGGWEPTPGACGSCMCVRVAGADEGMNPAVASMYGPNVASVVGASFMGVVGDRCGECADNQIDVLLDRPLSFAPFDKANPDGQDLAKAQAAAISRPHERPPAVRPSNRRAPLVNRLHGPRVLSAEASLRGQGRGAPESVGVYVADWQWAPCEWTHAQCSAMWRRLGFNGGASGGSWPPPMRSGVDSDTGSDIASPEQDRSFCCGEAEADVRVPEVSDALPEAVRATVAAAAAAAAAAATRGGRPSSSSADDDAAVAASAALAASWAAGRAGTTGGGSNATGQQQVQVEEQPMYNAADEFAASFATGGGQVAAPSLLAARTQRASGASLLSATRPTTRGSAAPAAATGQGSSAGAAAKTGAGGEAGKIAGAVAGATVGAAALAATAWALVQRGRAAAAAEGEAAAGAAAAASAAPAGGKSKDKGGGVPAFVMPPPPASGNGAEMGNGR